MAWAKRSLKERGRFMRVFHTACAGHESPKQFSTMRHVSSAMDELVNEMRTIRMQYERKFNELDARISFHTLRHHHVNE